MHEMCVNANSGRASFRSNRCPHHRESSQAQVVPFTKALAAFVDKISTLETHRDAAVKHQNDRSLSTVLDFVKSLAKASNAYPPAMAENVAFIIRSACTGCVLQINAALEPKVLIHLIDSNGSLTNQDNSCHCMRCTILCLH